MFIYSYNHISGISLTITSSGIIQTEEGMIKDIIWTLLEPFDTNVDGATFEVYKGYIESEDSVMAF